MSKSINSNIEYLDLEINKETLRKYEMCEQSTQSNEIELNDVRIGSSKVSVIPPQRPPPLKVIDSTSIDQDTVSASESFNEKKDNVLKNKIKEMKIGTKILYGKVTKAFKKSVLKKKEKKTSVQSPLILKNICKVDEETTLINHEHVKKAQTMQQMSSPSKRVISPTKAITINRINSTKEPLRPISNQYAEEFTSEHSILSSYSIMNVVEDFLKEEPENEEDPTMNEVFEHWIKVFINTCHQQIKDVVLTTNRSISQYIDLNGNGLINGQQNFIKVLTIPTWPQVRILEDKTSQRYIALKKSHSSSWFVLPRECPKLNQQWVCYPIYSLNTFENELRMTEEDSIQRILLRMMILKCFNKIHKNDIVPINFDINNILLASSNCGLIIIFREEKNELDIKTFDILRSDSLNDIPKQWSIVRQEVRERLMKLFYRINVISTLISSTWPVDNLAYILAKLITESDN